MNTSKARWLTTIMTNMKAKISHDWKAVVMLPERSMLDMQR